ncbi:MAG: PmoA family protein [Spirosomataceae bacterium]
MKKLIFCALGLFGLTQAQAQRIKLSHDTKNKKVDVVVDGTPLTSYIYPSEEILKKSVLFPLRTAKGTVITRGYPMEPRAGERVDHPHHVGMWLNYEDVNGFDYWNNSTAIKPEDRKKKYGTIRHTGITEMKSGNDKGTLVVTADWVSADGTGDLTLKETTTYLFSGKGNQRIIDRITTLTAQRDVSMPDVKDGMFAIRVARQLEHPSDKPDVFVDANGIETKVDKLDNTGIVGNYRSSEGIEGEKVWSTRGKWVNLRGKIGNEDISLAIIDHPKNVSYPTYWHARGYGLFAANPLGAKVFTNGKETLNFKLAKGQSVTFRYRTVITSGQASDQELNKLAEQFAQMN